MKMSKEINKRMWKAQLYHPIDNGTSMLVSLEADLIQNRQYKFCMKNDGRDYKLKYNLKHKVLK